MSISAQLPWPCAVMFWVAVGSDCTGSASMPPSQDLQKECTDDLCRYYSAGWEESDDTSLLQLSHANHQVNHPNAAQPEEGQREDVRSEELAASDAEPAPARNVAEQNLIAPDINLVQMEKMVSDMERMRGDGDEPSGNNNVDDDADSGNSNADVDDVSGASGSWSNNEQAALETLKSALQSQFIPFLDAEQTDDIREYNARTAVHQLCITHNIEDNAAVADAIESLHEKENKHKACRKSQKSWERYRSFAESSCAEASDILVMHQVYDKHEELADFMQASKMHAQTYGNLAPAGVKRDCAQDQQAYEEQWCAWRASKDESCTQLQRCFDAADLDDLKTKLETRAHNRRKIWHTVIKLQCRLSHLLSTFAGAEEDTSADDTSADTRDEISNFNTDDNCDDVTDTTRYVLSLDVPQHPSCSNAGDAAVNAIAPGGSTGSDWIAQKYSAGEGWSPTTHVVPSTCQTNCPAGTVTAPPASHEGCADDPAGCGFYNAHPDACGNYDTGSDVQSADCCACAASLTPPAAISQEFFTRRHIHCTAYEYHGEVGFDIRAKQPFTITHLGRHLDTGFYDRDEGSLSESVLVSLWSTSTQQALAQIQIGPDDEFEGDYAYAALSSPVTLQAGQEYRISQQCTVGMPDRWCDSNSFQAHTASLVYPTEFDPVTFIGAVQADQFGYPDGNGAANRRSGMMNFKFLPAEGAVRLMGMNAPMRGRLEIYHDGEWGTICYDHFDSQKAAPVVCDSLDPPYLGRNGPPKVYKCNDDGWMVKCGSGPIWMGDVDCTGQEARLDECPFPGWGVNNCLHQDDVGLDCVG